MTSLQQFVLRRQHSSLTSWQSESTTHCNWYRKIQLDNVLCPSPPRLHPLLGAACCEQSCFYRDNSLWQSIKHIIQLWLYMHAHTLAQHTCECVIGWLSPAKRANNAANRNKTNQTQPNRNCTSSIFMATPTKQRGSSGRPRIGSN